MAPADGSPLENPGQEPARYRDLLRKLDQDDRALFWDAIWDLANNPTALAEHGIRAVYGNVVYSRLRPGLIYVFRISNSGQVYPETVPDL